MHKKFAISNIQGLSDIIVGNGKLVKVCNEYNENLTIITSGKIPPNPSEMLGSKAMKCLVEQLKEDFDYIILDAPPVLAVSDAQILVNMADGVLVAIRAGSTKKENVNSALSSLKSVNANIIGTVLNMADTSKDDYHYYGNN